MPIDIYSKFYAAYAPNFHPFYGTGSYWLKKAGTEQHVKNANSLYHEGKMDDANGEMANAITTLYYFAVNTASLPDTPFYIAIGLLMLAIDLAGSINKNTSEWGLAGAMQKTHENGWDIENYQFQLPEGITEDIHDILYNRLKTVSHYEAYPKNVFCKFLNRQPEDYQQTDKKMLFKAIKMLPADKQIPLLEECLNPRTALGNCCWQQQGILASSHKKGILKKNFAELKKLKPNSIALRNPVKSAYTTCAGFFGFADSGAQPESNLDLAPGKLHTSHKKMGQYLLDGEYDIVYRLDKTAILSAIKTLKKEDQIPLLTMCLNRNHILGGRFWQQEGVFECSLEKGTLKKISDMLAEYQNLANYLRL